MNITDPIRRHALHSPDAEAVIRPNGRAIPYREFDRTIDYLVSGLKGLGLSAGAIAVTRTVRPYRDLCLRLAFARLGIVAAPRSMPEAGADLVLTEDADGVPAETGAKFVALDRIWPASGAALAELSPPSHQDDAAVCAIFPTSGTTGLPKFVAITHAQMAQRIATKASAARLPDGARLICTIGAGTAYGFLHRLAVLCGGGTVVITTGAQPLVPLIERHRVSHLAMAPFSLQRLLQALPPGAGPLRSLQQIEVGGAVLPPRLYQLARQRLCPNIVTQYGSAEAGPVAGAMMGSLEGRPGAVGYVYPGVEVQAVGDDDVAVPPGTEGLLRVRSGGCAHGYVGNPASGASVFKDDWVYPGDLGIVAADGLLSVRGRTGDVINQGGLKINPQAIEEVLLSVPEVADAAVFGVPDAMGVPRIWAAVVANGTLDLGALGALCREKLKKNAPTSILQIDALPRNEAGKVMRDDLRQRALAARAKRSGSTTTH